MSSCGSDLCQQLISSTASESKRQTNLKSSALLIGSGINNHNSKSFLQSGSVFKSLNFYHKWPLRENYRNEAIHTLFLAPREPHLRIRNKTLGIFVLEHQKRDFYFIQERKEKVENGRLCFIHSFHSIFLFPPGTKVSQEISSVQHIGYFT